MQQDHRPALEAAADAALVRAELVHDALVARAPVLAPGQRARVAEGEERARIWDRQVADMPGFGEYEARAGRRIPVVVLEPREG